MHSGPCDEKWSFLCWPQGTATFQLHAFVICGFHILGRSNLKELVRHYHNGWRKKKFVIASVTLEIVQLHYWFAEDFYWQKVILSIFHLSVLASFKSLYTIQSKGDICYLLSAAAAAAAAKSLQSCPTLCNPIDGSPPGSPVPGILQARILEWVAISFSNAWKWKVKVKSLSRVRPSATPLIAAY